MSVIQRKEGNQFNNTVERVKEHFYLPNYVAKLTGWVKGSGPGYWYTFCPLCQKDETRKPKHKFWLNRDVCGCFNPKCKLNNGSHDVIALHAMLNIRARNSKRKAFIGAGVFLRFGLLKMFLANWKGVNLSCLRYQSGYKRWLGQ